MSQDHTNPQSTSLDPVCGMSVDPERTPHHVEHEGTTYSFCSAGCARRFASTPAAYLNPPPVNVHVNVPVPVRYSPDR